MTVEEIKKSIVALDPYAVVKAGLDCFAPYAYFDLPASITDHMDQLTEDELQEVEEFMEEYLIALQSRGTIIDFNSISV